MENNLKRGLGITICTAALSGSMTLTAYCGQAYVNDKLISHTITKDNKIYVPLSEVSELLGAEIEYNPENNTAYVTGGTADKGGSWAATSTASKPTVTQSQLYPTRVETYDTSAGKEMIKVYELTEGQNPSNIPRDNFEENGYTYRLSDITKESLVTRDEKEATESITVNTKSKDINEVIKELPQEKEFTTSDGYSGVLKLDTSSIKTDVSGYKNYTYTVSDTRTYPGLASTDTSQIPKTVQKNGTALSLQSVDWQAANSENIDYNDIANSYTAVAKYSANASGRSVTGYQTTASYRGTVERTDRKGTVYTAKFTGTVFSVEQAKELVKEAKVHESLAAKAKKAGVTVEEFIAGSGGRENIKTGSPLPLIGGIAAFLGLAAAALAAGFLAFKKNVTIYARDEDGDYEKIGKIKLSKKKPIINLGNFNDVVSNPDFLLVLDKLTAWRMRDVDVTLHRGDTTMQHTVRPEKGKKYQFEVKF